MSNKSRITVKSITQVHVAGALADVGKAVYEIGESEVKGLSIRVRPRGATWILRGRLGPKQTTWTIGPVEKGDISAIRARALAAKAQLELGVDPREDLDLARRGGNEIVRHFDAAKDGLLWEEARDGFLRYVQQKNAAATYDDYRKTLKAAHLKPLLGKPIKKIDEDDIKKIQMDIIRAGFSTQAAHVTRIVKVAFKWFGDAGYMKSRDNPALHVTVIKKTKSESAEDYEDLDGSVPTEEQLGRLPWLLDKPGVNREARLAAMMVLLTLQRRETVASAKIEHFRYLENGTGMVWAMPPATVKSKRVHVIPLPDYTTKLVERLIDRADAPRGWLFPQQRLRRAGDAGGNHMAAKSIYEAMTVDAGSSVTPHAVRRAFGTYGESLLKFTRSATKSILDHAEGEAGDVTAQFYALHRSEEPKWRTMKAWETYIFGLIRHHAVVDVHEDYPNLPLFCHFLEK